MTEQHRYSLLFANNTIKIFDTLLFFGLLLTMSSSNDQTEKTISINIAGNQEAAALGAPKNTVPVSVDPQTMFRCSLKDKDGNIWFGTTGAGIYKYNGKLFTHYSEKEGLSNNFVVGLAQDIKGNIWAATNDGVFYSNGNIFSRLAMPKPGALKIGISNDNFSAKTTQVFCVLGDKKGNIWFGTENEGLWKYDGTKLTNYKCEDSTWIESANTGPTTTRQKGFISAMLEDTKGNIWFSSSATGLNYFDGKSFQKPTADFTGIHVLQMIEDMHGIIWLATRVNGICRYNGKTLKSFMEKNGVNDNMASCLCETKNGNIWSGSLGKAGTGGHGFKGLTVFDGKTFMPISSAGMRNNQVWTIVEDNAGNIWIGTKEFGLFRYDGKSFTECTTKSGELLPTTR